MTKNKKITAVSIFIGDEILIYRRSKCARYNYTTKRAQWLRNTIVMNFNYHYQDSLWDDSYQIKSCKNIKFS